MEEDNFDLVCVEWVLVFCYVFEVDIWMEIGNYSFEFCMFENVCFCFE